MYNKALNDAKKSWNIVSTSSLERDVFWPKKVSRCLKKRWSMGERLGEYGGFGKVTYTKSVSFCSHPDNLRLSLFTKQNYDQAWTHTKKWKCSESVSHNRVQVLWIPVLLFDCSQDWTFNLQMIVSLEAEGTNAYNRYTIYPAGLFRVNFWNL